MTTTTERRYLAALKRMADECNELRAEVKRLQYRQRDVEHAAAGAVSEVLKSLAAARAAMEEVASRLQNVAIAVKLGDLQSRNGLRAEAARLRAAARGEP